jgi:hypothetical protein
VFHFLSPSTALAMTHSCHADCGERRPSQSGETASLATVSITRRDAPQSLHCTAVTGSTARFGDRAASIRSEKLVGARSAYSARSAARSAGVPSVDLTAENAAWSSGAACRISERNAGMRLIITKLFQRLPGSTPTSHARLIPGQASGIAPRSSAFSSSYPEVADALRGFASALPSGHAGEFESWTTRGRLEPPQERLIWGDGAPRLSRHGRLLRRDFDPRFRHNGAKLRRGSARRS